METLAIISLVGNIVQFVDFSGKLLSKLTEAYRSSESALHSSLRAQDKPGKLHVAMGLFVKYSENVVVACLLEY
jgi:hypothetical protein